MKHKHYDCIVAWAEGKEIEVKTYQGFWEPVIDPAWKERCEYRIKPEPKPDFVVYGFLTIKEEEGTLAYPKWKFEPMPEYPNNLKLTFDGEGNLKDAEMIK